MRESGEQYIHLLVRRLILFFQVSDKTQINCSKDSFIQIYN